MSAKKKVVANLFQKGCPRELVGEVLVVQEDLVVVKNRGLEGVWGCFVACLRPKAPVGRFLDGSGAALGRLLAHLGRLLGGSWAVLGARLGRSRAS